MKELKKSLIKLLDVGLHDALSELDAVRLRIYNLDIYLLLIALMATIFAALIGYLVVPTWWLCSLVFCTGIAGLVLWLNTQYRLYLSSLIFGCLLVALTLVSYQSLNQEHILYFFCVLLSMFFFFYKTRVHFYRAIGLSALLFFLVPFIDYNPFLDKTLNIPSTVHLLLYTGAYLHLLYKLAAYYFIHEQIVEKWKEENIRYKNIFENNPAGIIGTQALGDSNPAFCRMLGYTREELSKKRMEDITLAQDKGQSRAMINKLYTGELKSFQLEKSYVRKDGSLMPARVQVRGLYDNEGNFLHTTATVIDLTEERRREQELLAAKEKAEKSDRLKSAFLANMSHEIRTPMNGIVGFSAMLLEGDLDETQKKEYTLIINDCCNQLLNIVNNVLDLAKIQTDSLELHQENAALNQLLSETLNLFRLEAEKKKIYLRTTFLHRETYLHTDTIKLRQIITNLLSNAVKFTEQGGITLGYKIAGERLRIYVQDTGAGISLADQAKIFKRFQRVGATVNKVRGAGLGLAICKGFAEALGGKIHFESEEKVGTTFYLEIPYQLTTVPVATLPSTPPTASLASLAGKTILIAEDEAYNFKLLNNLLKKYDIHILWAKNGQEAVDMVQAAPTIDLILMDVKMPVMNGLEATKIIQQQHQIPIIAQSAQAFQDEKEAILQAGCVAHLSKPIQRSELFDTILKFIGG